MQAFNTPSCSVTTRCRLAGGGCSERLLTLSPRLDAASDLVTDVTENGEDVAFNNSLDAAKSRLRDAKAVNTAWAISLFGPAHADIVGFIEKMTKGTAYRFDAKKNEWCLRTPQGLLCSVINVPHDLYVNLSCVVQLGCPADMNLSVALAQAKSWLEFVARVSYPRIQFAPQAQ